MISLALVALVAGLALVVAYRHELAGRWQASTEGSRVADVMSPGVSAISAQLTVEEVTNGAVAPTERAAYAVTDARGRVLGVLLRDDLLRIPHTERPARLVADVARAAVVDGSAGLREALERPGVAAAGTAVVVDAALRPVGMLSVDDAQHVLPVAAEEARDEPLAGLTADTRPSRAIRGATR